MSATPPEVTVVLEPPLPDIVVTLEPALPETQVVLAEVGLVGPRGPAGPPGLAGGGYLHEQAAPAATCTVEHGLGTKPSIVVVLASAPTEPVYTDVEYPDDFTAVIAFPSAESGWAYI
jgi:hypothetical protein